MKAGRAAAFAAGIAAALWLAAPGAAAAPSAAPADAAEAAAARCEAAVLRAARAEGVPERLLRAVALAESGRRLGGRLRPWPWTVNMEGEGRWFESPEALLAWVRRRQAQGARSFDLGCLQVNHLWHGAAFADLEEMLEPEANARYAARFLRDLHAESGSWETAAGRYHSRTPALAERYRARVLALMAGLGAAEAPGPEPAPGRPGPRRPRPPGAGGPLIDLAAAGPALFGPPAAAAGGLLRPARPLFGPAARGAAR